MTGEKLLDAIGAIDDALITEAKEDCHRERSEEKRFRLLPLVAAIAVLLSLSVLVAAAGALIGLFDHIRNEADGKLTPEQELLIQEGIMHVGEKKTIDGTSITLNEVYGDGTNFWFYLTFEGDGLDDLERIQIKKMDLVLKDEKRHSEDRQIKTLPDSNPDDGKRECLLKVSRTSDGIDRTNKAVVGVLQLIDLIDTTSVDPEILEQVGRNEGAKIIAKGEWLFRFELTQSGGYEEMEVNGIELSGNAALNGEDIKTATVDSIALRTLGMEMYYSTDPSIGTLDFEKPIVVLEDGSQIILKEKFGGCVTNGVYTGKRYVTYTSDGPIILENVVAIRYGEIVIPWIPTKP